MAISTKAREAYHPTIDERGYFMGGERDYHGRLRIIEEHVSFSDKTVLDLGCSGGFFTFSAARTARRVIGVDADAHMIEKNRQAALEHGYDNVSFLCRSIDASLFEELPKADIVLFLSVFHHMITDSGTYEWSPGADVKRATDLLYAASGLAETFVFEMGSPDEGFKWCDDVACLSDDLPAWVIDNAFGHEFDNVNRLRGSAIRKFPFSMLPSIRRVIPGGRLGRRVLRRLGVDVRDFRDIYIGTKNKEGGKRPNPG